DAHRRATARLWMKRVDDLLHPACVTLTFALAFRRALAHETEPELDARFDKVRDPILRDRQRIAVQQGWDAPHVPGALVSYDSLLGELDALLGRSPFVTGDTYSLADAAIAPYVWRAELLGLNGLWVERRPNVIRWFERIRARRSFEEAV